VRSSGGGGADLEPEGKGIHLVGDRLVEVPQRLAQATQGGVASGGARLVADALLDFEGLAVEGLGGVVVPPQLGQHAELVIAVGDAGLVAEALVDVQGLAVKGLGGVVVPRSWARMPSW
jgi:hypothetical protein